MLLKKNRTPSIPGEMIQFDYMIFFKMASIKTPTSDSVGGFKTAKLSYDIIIGITGFTSISTMGKKLLENHPRLRPQTEHQRWGVGWWLPGDHGATMERPCGFGPQGIFVKTLQLHSGL